MDSSRLSQDADEGLEGENSRQSDVEGAREDSNGVGLLKKAGLQGARYTQVRDKAADKILSAGRSIWGFFAPTTPSESEEQLQHTDQVQQR
jgi:hypothetical protein